MIEIVPQHVFGRNQKPDDSTLYFQTLLKIPVGYFHRIFESIMGAYRLPVLKIIVLNSCKKFFKSKI